MSESQFAHGALKLLFPTARDDSGPLRICNGDRLFRYLSFGPEQALIEVTEINALLQDADELARRLSDQDSAEAFLRAIRGFHTQLTMSDPAAVVAALCDSASSHFPGRAEADQLTWLFAAVLEQLLRVAGDKAAMSATIFGTAPLTIGAKLLFRAAIENREIPGSVSRYDCALLPTEAFVAAKGTWLARLPNPEALLLEPAPYLVLSAWGALSRNFRAPREAARKLAESDPLRFLEQIHVIGEFAPTPRHLDLVADRVDLIAMIEAAIVAWPAIADGLRQAVETLQSPPILEYFQSRTEAPSWALKDDPE